MAYTPRKRHGKTAGEHDRDHDPRQRHHPRRACRRVLVLTAGSPARTRARPALGCSTAWPPTSARTDSSPPSLHIRLN